MKRINKFFGIGLSFAAVAGLASCDNKVDNEPTVVPEEEAALPTVVLPQDPSLVISSNNIALAGDASKIGGTREGTLKYENDEVEINLALQDVHYNANGELKYGLEDLVSHLSIHVRSNTNVDVTLPVPARIYCDQDDLYIYNDRGEGFKYEGSVNRATYTLKAGEVYYVSELNEETNKYENVKKTTEGGEVTLNIAFNEAGDGTDGSIRIWTTGITEELINYCRWTYGDGINFDAYNYYNRANMGNIGSFDSYTVPEILEDLNDSKVSFTTAPEYYINAFTGDVIKYTTEDETSYYYRDCWVEPANNSLFYAPALGQNGWNHVYVNASNQNAIDGEIGEKPAEPWVAPAPATPTTPGGSDEPNEGTGSNGGQD